MLCAVQVRVNAVLGVPTEDHTVYENLDLMVHPMRVHINDTLLSNLWVRASARLVRMA